MEDITTEKNGISWERSLVNQNGSLFISIPKIWCILYGVKKGDKVALKLLRDGTLKVSPEVGQE